MTNMENNAFKDNPKFLIITSVLVPIFISIVGLAGIILPKLIPTPTTSSQSTVSEPEKTQISQSNSPTIVANDTYGYLSSTSIVNSISSSIVTLKTTRSGEDYEVQLISGEYYVLGYSSELNASSLQITSRSNGDFTKKVAVKFKDINSINADQVKVKKDSYNVLSINAKSIRTDLSFH